MSTENDLFAYSNYKFLHECFKKVASTFPNQIALDCMGKRYTYKQLDHKAAEIQKKLINLGVEKGDLIAICLNHGIELIASILAVMKCGAAYVPLDPRNPEKREEYIINDSFPKIIIRKNQLPTSDSIELTPLFTKEASNHSRPTDLAYIIYTSGTTGNPKGVMINHANVLALFMATNKLFDFNKGDTWVHYHSYAFDFSVWEIWGALLYGAKLLVPDLETTIDPFKFSNYIIENGVTVLNQTPTGFSNFSPALIEKLKGNRKCNLRYVIFGGEKLIPSILKDWIENIGDQKPKIINMYGITETTVHSTFHEVSRRDLSNNLSVIGKPLDGFTMRLLSIDTCDGSSELLLAGPQVCVGYLNRDELNKEKFILNDKYSNLYYKTGDIVKLQGNGDLVYIRRKDNQVKIRGHRIELEEVEKVINNLPGIRCAHVTSYNNGLAHELICFYVIKGGAISKRQIKEKINQSIPSYMVPRYLVPRSNIPNTINSKVNFSEMIAEWEGLRNENN